MNRHRLRELLNLASKRARAAGKLDTPLINFLTDEERTEKSQIQAQLKAEDN